MKASRITFRYSLSGGSSFEFSLVISNIIYLNVFILESFFLSLLYDSLINRGYKNFFLMAQIGKKLLYFRYLRFIYFERWQQKLGNTLWVELKFFIFLFYSFHFDCCLNNVYKIIIYALNWYYYGAGEKIINESKMIMHKFDKNVVNI